MARIYFTESAGSGAMYGYEACGALQTFLQNADAEPGSNLLDIVNYLGAQTQPRISFLDEPEKLESVTSYPLIYLRPGALRPEWETTGRSAQLEHDIRARVFTAWAEPGDPVNGVGEAYAVASAIAALVMQTNKTTSATDWKEWYCNNGEPMATVSDPGTIDHDTGSLVFVDVDITYRHCERTYQ